MYELTQNEQIAFIIGIFSIISIVVVSLFSSEPWLNLLLLGGITIFSSLIIIYVFIIQPMRNHTRSPSYNQYYTPRSASFRPTIIPPPKMTKKTVMKGLCEHCGRKELMGFTCSYCNRYFCAEHRLPEKHDCLGIDRR
ncbi:MAG: AN1-type zinc finger domain-containing protein [Promethearchaeota archaeon]